MATIAPPPPQIDVTADSGNGRFVDDWKPGGDPPSHNPSLPDHRYYTGIYLGLGAVTMLFAAFSSAMVVRSGLSNDWEAVALPPILFLSTLILLASSLTLEKAKRVLPELKEFRMWWLVSVFLGLGFLAGQLWAWNRLAASGVYLSSNPGSSFFYVLTASHGIHLIGGLLALTWVYFKFGRVSWGGTDSAKVGITSIYWHFMGVLWVYVFLLLLFWR